MAGSTFDWLSEVRNEDLSSQLRLIEWLRSGIPFGDLSRFITLIGMTREEASLAFGISLRTLARRKETSSLLAQGEGERMVRFARVLTKAQDVLGSLEKAKSWMKLENRALGGATPMSLLDTDIGAQAVQDVLGRIEYGVFS